MRHASLAVSQRKKDDGTLDAPGIGPEVGEESTIEVTEHEEITVGRLSQSANPSKPDLSKDPAIRCAITVSPTRLPYLGFRGVAEKARFSADVLTNSRAAQQECSRREKPST